VVSDKPVSRIDLAEELIPFGAKILDLITVSPCQRFNLLFANPEEFAHTHQFGLKSGDLQSCVTGFGMRPGPNFHWLMGMLDDTPAVAQSLPTAPECIPMSDDRREAEGS
jgi:hypothetical protein